MSAMGGKRPLSFPSAGKRRDNLIGCEEKVSFPGMATRMGENIQREWDNEPLARELWEALRVRKEDRLKGAALLTELASQGSTLAMMYLGDLYIRGSNREEIEEGEKWLIRSADGGSIEGRYQLARHYCEERSWNEARAELQALAVAGYSPAMYALAQLLHRGDFGYKAVQDAIEYLRSAIAAGHLPSIALLSKIYRKEKFGLRVRMAAHWLCVTRIPALLKCTLSYPNSDRIRPILPAGRL